MNRISGLLYHRQRRCRLRRHRHQCSTQNYYCVYYTQKKSSYLVLFQGCLHDIQYKSLFDIEWREPGYPAGVVEAGRNVQQCPYKECSVFSCQNGATCQDLGASFRYIKHRLNICSTSLTLSLLLDKYEVKNNFCIVLFCY